MTGAGGMFRLSRVSEHSTYTGGLLGPMIVTAAGLGSGYQSRWGGIRLAQVISWDITLSEWRQGGVYDRHADP